MTANKHQLEATLAAIDSMTEEEYSELYAKAAEYTGPEIVVPEPEICVELRIATFKTNVINWAEFQPRGYVVRKEAQISLSPEPNLLSVA